MNSTGNHHKHPPLAKPALGEWGRNEIAILGAPCPVIKELSERIARELQPQRLVCYVDASHADEGKAKPEVPFAMMFTDLIHSRQINVENNPSLFARRALLASNDLILVNGNHFTAKEQIVLLHAKKMESLQRKTERLTNVIAVLEVDRTFDDCSFLQPFLNEKTKLFRSTEESALIGWLNERVSTPPVNGLVLAGGKSLRMGMDKSQINYYGIPHKDYLLQLIGSLDLRTYLSCRPDQVDTIGTDYPLITDRFLGLGPYGALLSAMMQFPDEAWLVVATDLPLVTAETLHQLLSNRNPSKVATAFHNPATGLPEPLITLWEPRAYPLLLSFLAQGNTCPRKALINSDIQLIHADNPDWLINVNTPEDLKEVKAKAEAKEARRNG